MNRHIYTGTSISSGIGMGEIFVLELPELKINMGEIEESQIEKEILRLEKAIDKTLIEINDLKASFAKRLKKQEKLIFEAYKSILQDKYFIEEVKDIINDCKCFADNAIEICIQNYIKAIEISENEYAKQSIYDLNDICSKIIKNMNEENTAELIYGKVSSNHIVVVNRLTFSIAAVLGKKRVKGIIVCEEAGYLSHAVIILRGLGIPVLSNVSHVIVKYTDSIKAVIDADNGELIENPDDADVKKYSELLRSKLKRQKENNRIRYIPAVTTDGIGISVTASIGSFEECNLAVKNKVEGIGLLRTEILFADNEEVPDEKGQYNAYSRIARKMKGKPVVIRTLDFGEDKIPANIRAKTDLLEDSIRGIEYSLTNKDQFLMQIISIIRATENGNLSIAFPVVNTREEVVSTKLLIQRAYDKLSLQGKTFDSNIKIGAFIETITGVGNIEGILCEVDFISIGTNDLLHQVTGQDRRTPTGEYGGYLNPEFLKLIKSCIGKAHNQNKNVTICGEMPSDPAAAVILLGMGAHELSVYPSKATKINRLISEISIIDAQAIANNALDCTSVAEVQGMFSHWISKRGIGST